MKTYIFPCLLIALNVGAAIMYAIEVCVKKCEASDEVKIDA